MAGTFIVLWTQDRCRWLEHIGDAGKPLLAMFGGHHQSAPSFRKHGVQPGDAICPVLVKNRIMHVVACLRVERFMTTEEYIKEFIPLSAQELAIPQWKLQEELYRTRPELGHRLPLGCLDEAAIGTSEACIRFDRALTPEQLTQLRMVTRKGEIRQLKYVEDGQLKSVVTLQGRVYRLYPESEDMFEQILATTNQMIVKPSRGGT